MVSELTGHTRPELLGQKAFLLLKSLSLELKFGALSLESSYL